MLTTWNAVATTKPGYATASRATKPCRSVSEFYQSLPETPPPSHPPFTLCLNTQERQVRMKKTSRFGLPKNPVALLRRSNVLRLVLKRQTWKRQWLGVERLVFISIYSGASPWEQSRGRGLVMGVLC